jgi:hypothetical protein
MNAEPEFAPAPLRGRYAAVLASAAALTLLFGLLLRPTPPPKQRDVSPPSETELERLSRLAQRRMLTNEDEFFASIAQGLAGSVGRLPALGTTAIVWATGVVVTASSGQPVPAALTLDGPGGDVAAQWMAGGAQSPVAVLRLEPPEELPVAPRAGAPSPGARVVVVWQGPAGRGVAPARLLEIRPSECGGEEAVASLSLSRSVAGAGLFDLDGRLVAVVLPCGDRFAAITVASLDAIVASIVSETRRPAGMLVQRYGIRVTQMGEAERRLLGRRTGGVYVSEVWDSYRAASAFEPGDVVDSVDGVPARSVADVVTAAVREGREVTLGIRRGPQRLDIPLAAATSASRSAAAAIGGLRMAHGPTPVIDAVSPGSRPALAGLQSGDRIISMNGRPLRDASDLSRALLRKAPVLLQVARPGRRLTIFVP